MNRRFAIAVCLLFAFCASYAAPLAGAFQGSGMSCCNGKNSCCRRSHAAGWMANPDCGGKCPCASFAIAAAAPAVATSVARLVVPDAARTQLSSERDRVPQCCNSAFLYQRPPPEIGV